MIFTQKRNEMSKGEDVSKKEHSSFKLEGESNSFRKLVLWWGAVVRCRDDEMLGLGLAGEKQTHQNTKRWLAKFLWKNKPDFCWELAHK